MRDLRCEKKCFKATSCQLISSLTCFYHSILSCVCLCAALTLETPSLQEAQATDVCLIPSVINWTEGSDYSGLSEYHSGAVEIFAAQHFCVSVLQSHASARRCVFSASGAGFFSP